MSHQQTEIAQDQKQPRERVSGWARIVLGLLAVYAPIVIGVLSNGRLLGGRIYVVLSLWAIEGIAWYWHENRVDSRRRRELGIWTPEH
jgi:hypothetical protein